MTASGRAHSRNNSMKNFDFRAFVIGLVALGVLGVAIAGFAPKAGAFCGALKKDPQPNHATADCR